MQYTVHLIFYLSAIGYDCRCHTLPGLVTNGPAVGCGLPLDAVIDVVLLLLASAAKKQIIEVEMSSSVYVVAARMFWMAQLLLQAHLCHLDKL